MPKSASPSPKKKTSKEVKALCARIERLRLEQGLSVRKFAAACDISSSQVNEIGNAGIDLRYSTLVKIARGLGLSLADLLDS